MNLARAALFGTLILGGAQLSQAQSFDQYTCYHQERELTLKIDLGRQFLQVLTQSGSELTGHYARRYNAETGSTTLILENTFVILQANGSVQYDLDWRCDKI